jgi:hypothetical protein
MNYTIDTDLWDLRQRINILEVNSDKHNARLNKLEGIRDEKEQVSADPSKLESNKDYALDWYINQYQNMCKEYNKVKIELDNKQKVLEMVMDQRGRYIKQFMDAENKVKEFEENIYNLTKKNQMLRGTIKNHEDRILELEKEAEYRKTFSSPFAYVVLCNGELEAVFNSKEAAFKFTADFVKRVGYQHNYFLIDRYEINTNVSVVMGTVNAQGEVVDE